MNSEQPIRLIGDNPVGHFGMSTAPGKHPEIRGVLVGHAEPFVRIDMTTGEVFFGDGYTPEAAAHQFFEALGNMYGKPGGRPE